MDKKKKSLLSLFNFADFFSVYSYFEHFLGSQTGLDWEEP